MLPNKKIEKIESAPSSNTNIKNKNKKKLSFFKIIIIFLLFWFSISTTVIAYFQLTKSNNYTKSNSDNSAKILQKYQEISDKITKLNEKDISDPKAQEEVKKLTQEINELRILNPYNLNSKLVRGLDYYTRTTFEIWYKGSKENAAASALGGGGRYDNLAELLGGRPTAAIGMALGVERIKNILEEKNINVPERSKKTDVLLIQLGDLAKKKALGIFDEMIKGGIKVKEALHKSSIKSQLRLADNLGAKFAVIIGQKEILDKTVLIRDMKSGIQEIVSYDKLLEELKMRLRNYGKKK